jgi:hypothetical protein
MNKQRFYTSPLYTTRLAPFIAVLNQILVSLLSLSMRAIISRLFIVIFVLLFYFFDIAPRGTELESQRRILENAGLMGGNNSTILFQSA